MHRGKTTLTICLAVASVAAIALFGSGTSLSLRGSSKARSVGFHAKRSLLKAFIYAGKKFNKMYSQDASPDCARIANATTEAVNCIYSNNHNGHQSDCVADVVVDNGLYGADSGMVNLVTTDLHILDAEDVSFPEESAENISNDIASLCTYGVTQSVYKASKSPEVSAGTRFISLGQLEELVANYVNGSLEPMCEAYLAERGLDNVEDCALIEEALRVFIASADLTIHDETPTTMK